MYDTLRSWCNIPSYNSLLLLVTVCKIYKFYTLSLAKQLNFSELCMSDNGLGLFDSFLSFINCMWYRVKQYQDEDYRIEVILCFLCCKDF